MFRAAAVVLLLMIASPVWAGPAQPFDEEEAYATWKAHYTECIAPSWNSPKCQQNYYLADELEQRGWCWVAYDQDMMRPGSSRYLNEYFGEATCPKKS